MMVVCICTTYADIENNEISITIALVRFLVQPVLLDKCTHRTNTSL